MINWMDKGSLSLQPTISVAFFPNFTKTVEGPFLGLKTNIFYSFVEYFLIIECFAISVRRPHIKQSARSLQ